MLFIYTFSKILSIAYKQKFNGIFKYKRFIPVLYSYFVINIKKAET
jgi:hypothetical protein